jgi:hypothetical protein
MGVKKPLYLNKACFFFDAGVGFDIALVNIPH